MNGPSMLLPVALMLAAAAGAAGAATIARPRSLRAAHAVMAVVMISMLLPGGRPVALAGLIALGLAGVLAVRHHRLHATGLPCAIDLAGMALLMAVLALGRPRLAVVVLLATGWAISSLWAHGEVALRTRLSPAIALEATTATVGAIAMAVMASAMTG